MTRTTDPFAAAGWTVRRLGVVMAPDPDDPREAGGRVQPGLRPRPRRGAVPVPAPGRRGQLLPGRAGPGPLRRRRPRRGRAARGRAGAGGAVGAAPGRRRGRGPADHLRAHPRPLCHDLHRLGAAGAAHRPGHLDRPGALGAAGAGRLRLRPRPAGRPQPVPEQGRAAVPRTGARPGRGAGVRPAAPADVGPVVGQPGRGRAPPARPARPAARDLGVVRRRPRRCWPTPSA